MQVISSVLSASSSFPVFLWVQTLLNMAGSCFRKTGKVMCEDDLPIFEIKAYDIVCYTAGSYNWRLHMPIG